MLFQILLASVLIVPGEEWTPLRFGLDVKDGSLLDFSEILPADRPAGARHGRLVVDGDGHLRGEKSGERVRLVGANLNFDANFLEPEYADALARRLRRMGYNAVRLHHTDVLLMSGGWNGCWSDAIDPKMLERLDYLFAAMKREGLYVTTDFYQMRRVNKDELKSLRLRENLDFGWFKAFPALYDAGFEVWAKYPRKLMEHVNPHTGLAWKDDEALAFVVASNEDTLLSICGHVEPQGDKKGRRASQRFEDCFLAWEKKNEVDLDLSGENDEERWWKFFLETGAGVQRRYREFLNGKLGYRGLVSGANWFDQMSIIYERNELGLVDNHAYADHPQSREGGWTEWNQSSNLKHGSPAYAVPLIKAPTRIWGKPMAITEWNFCAPNRYRAESGPEMGAYAAFQDWDATFRFAWSHGGANVKALKPLSPKSWFDLATDPLNQLSDRINVLLFRRGDVAPAKERHAYAVTLQEVMNAPMGDMWQGGRFPHSFTLLGYVHGVGSVLADGGAEPKGLKHVWTAQDIRRLRNAVDFKGDVVSDTGELEVNRGGRFTVATPRSEAVVACPGAEKPAAAFTAGGLVVKPVDEFQVVSASSMDGVPLRQSKKVLFFHLSNVYPTKFQFNAPNLHCVDNWGRLPYLARCCAAEVSFRSGVAGLALYALRSDGTPIRRVESAYRDGAYVFRLAVSPKEEAALVYALLPEGSVEVDASPAPFEGLEDQETVKVAVALAEKNGDRAVLTIPASPLGGSVELLLPAGWEGPSNVTVRADAPVSVEIRRSAP